MDPAAGDPQDFLFQADNAPENKNNNSKEYRPDNRGSCQKKADDHNVEKCQTAGYELVIQIHIYTKQLKS
jgi:hypothetical protein